MPDAIFLDSSLNKLLQLVAQEVELFANFANGLVKFLNARREILEHMTKPLHCGTC
jgi:hypothetical protein